MRPSARISVCTNCKFKKLITHVEAQKMNNLREIGNYYNPFCIGLLKI